MIKKKEDVLAYILVECVNDRGKLSIPSIINWHLECMLFSLKGKMQCSQRFWTLERFHTTKVEGPKCGCYQDQGQRVYAFYAQKEVYSCWITGMF